MKFVRAGDDVYVIRVESLGEREVIEDVLRDAVEDPEIHPNLGTGDDPK